MDGTCRHVAIETGPNLFQNCPPIGVFTQSHDSEKHGLFEGAEMFGHCLYCRHLGQLVKRDLGRDASLARRRQP